MLCYFAFQIPHRFCFLTFTTQIFVFPFRTRLYLEYKLCRLLLRTLDNRAACASSRGLRGYSRATSCSVLSPIGNGVRPSSHSSNHSWPASFVRHFGRRPLGSATSLPAMLNLGMGQKPVEGRNCVFFLFIFACLLFQFYFLKDVIETTNFSF